MAAPARHAASPDRTDADRADADRAEAAPSVSAPADAGRAVAAGELPQHARELLAGDALGEYRRLFDHVGRIADPHHRYWAGTGLVEEGLAAAVRAAAARLPALLVTLADGVLELLEREPREPRLLNHAGVVLYELWSVEAARAMFAAAGRLDPQLPEVSGNLRRLAVRERLIRTAHAQGPLRGALPEISRRALDVAARAQPATGQRLSLCMIVRDEERMLARCLSAVAGAVDEIVIVDTGSTDATIEIARSYGARVFERAWTGSFAEARNVSFDAAHGDWVMYLDAD
jgi:Glycosyl transferase family 2